MLNVLGFRGFHLRLRTAWCVALLVAGCSRDQVTVEEFCAGKAARECEVVAVMCVADRKTCETLRASQCMQSVPNLTTRPFRPENVDRCLEKTSEVYRKPTLTPQDRAAVDSVCQRVFGGNATTGKPCTADYECAEPLICHTRSGDPQLCAPRVVLAADAFCNNPGEVCPAGQYCATALGTRQCVARAATGQACDAETLCEETLRCAGTDGAMVCTNRQTAGETCASNADCAPAAPYCNPYYGNTCDPGFTPSRGNAECAAFGAIVAGNGGAGGSGAGGSGGTSATPAAAPR